LIWSGVVRQKLALIFSHKADSFIKVWIIISMKQRNVEIILYAESCHFKSISVSLSWWEPYCPSFDQNV
jgi:hypothetical protein